MWVSAECNRYIFSLQVKPDRQQLLPIARALSLSSKNTATTKAQIRSGSIANMPPIAVSVAVVDRLQGPRLVPVGVPVGLVPPRQQQKPLGIPPAQPLLSLNLITAEP